MLSVLWVASLMPCDCLIGPTGVFHQRTCAQPDHRSGGDLLRPRRLGTGGKTEPGFFAIVKAEAELSAQKRGLVLPDSETVGREFGEYIKTQAKADHDQLLYAIVDRAVRKYGTKPAAGGSK